MPKYREQEKKTAKECLLVKRDLYLTFNSRKINHRFYYLRSLRFSGNKTEWSELVNWARNYIKDHPEDLIMAPSECVMTSCPTVH